MGARREPPGGAVSLRLEVEPVEVHAEASAANVKLHVEAEAALISLTLTGDAAIDLANQLTDAVDQLDGRSQ